MNSAEKERAEERARWILRKKQGKLQRIHEMVRDQVFFNQTDLVNEFFDGDFDFEGKEVHQWWIVSDWLFNQLKSRGEIVLENKYGDWWGRQVGGQAVDMDDVFKEIDKTEQEESEEEPVDVARYQVV